MWSPLWAHSSCRDSGCWHALCGCRVLPEMHTPQWSTVTAPGLAGGGCIAKGDPTGACTVMGLSCGAQGWHLAREHPQRLGCCCRSQALAGGGERERERLRWLVTVKTCGEKTSMAKSARGLQFVLSVGFFTQLSVGSSTQQTTGNCGHSHGVAGTGSSCPSSL